MRGSRLISSAPTKPNPSPRRYAYTVGYIVKSFAQPEGAPNALVACSYLERNYRTVTQFADAKAFVGVAMKAAGEAEGAEAAFSLLVKMGRDNDNCCKLVVDTLVGLQQQKKGTVFTETAQLRLYCLLSERIPLSNAFKLLLFGAANKHWEQFVNMECAIDPRLSASLGNLRSHEFGNASVAAIVETGKKHPLLTMRKLGEIRDLLETDAGSKGARTRERSERVRPASA